MSSTATARYSRRRVAMWCHFITSFRRTLRWGLQKLVWLRNVSETYRTCLYYGKNASLAPFPAHFEVKSLFFALSIWKWTFVLQQAAYPSNISHFLISADRTQMPHPKCQGHALSAKYSKINCYLNFDLANVSFSFNSIKQMAVTYAKPFILTIMENNLNDFFANLRLGTF